MGSNQFLKLFLQNIVVLSMVFKFLRKNHKISQYFGTNDFSAKSKKCIFFSYKICYNFLKNFLAKSFKVKKVRYLYYGLVKILKNMVSTMFRYKKCICDTKKELKSRNF
jgi:hypothetical protein